MIDIVPNWHPLLVHFPIALLSLSAVLYLAGLLMPDAALLRAEWHTVARWSLWIGFAFALAAAAAGWQAFDTVAHDEPSHAAMTVHRNWALATLAAYAPFVLWTAAKRRRPSSEPGIVFAVFLLLPTLLLGVTAYRGAELVYRHGLGVESLPVTEEGRGGHGHHEPAAHTHEDGHTH